MQLKFPEPFLQKKKIGDKKKVSHILRKIKYCIFLIEGNNSESEGHEVKSLSSFLKIYYPIFQKHLRLSGLRIYSFGSILEFSFMCLTTHYVIMT